MNNAVPPSLLSTVSPIRRARGYRLYLANGKRLIDLWQLNGGAILGHTPARMLLSLKNDADRGLFVPLPHPNQGRLEKALLAFAPSYAGLRLYATRAEADAALASSGLGPQSLSELPDPAFADTSSEAVAALWRPWTRPDAVEAHIVQQRGLLVPILPLNWPSAPLVFLLSRGALDRFPQTPPCSPLLLGALARGLADLRAVQKERGGESKSFLPKTIAALRKSSWIQRGLYVNAGYQGNPDEYKKLFHQFVASGYLLPPDPGLPIILPSDLSSGEDAGLAALIKKAAPGIL
ncbi:hypothetical protein MASR2M78_12060 [Treponema sp.]